MKKIIMGCTVMAAIALMSTACSNQNKTVKEVDTTAVEETTTEQEQQSLKKMTEQGNPLEVNLAEISEENDGKYRMVFDAKKALGGTIDNIGSLQIVFPGFDEKTATKVKVISAGYLGGDADISDYVTGKVE